MKLTEVKDLYHSNDFWKIENSAPEQWLEYLGIDNYNVVDGKINLHSIKLTPSDLTSKGELPFPFNVIHGYFLVAKNNSGPNFLADFNGPELVNAAFHIEIEFGGSNLTRGPKQVGDYYKISNAPDLVSLEGIPEIINGNLTIGKTTKLTSLDYFPKQVLGNANLSQARIKSLVGIGDKIQKINGFFEINWECVQEGGLGLLLIEDLSGLRENRSIIGIEAFDIIDQYIGHPDKIFECQQELLEAGLDKFAQL